MSIESVLGWIVCGLIVGLIARFLVPGTQRASLATTVMLGIVGALVGGFLYSLVRGAAVAPFSLDAHNWYGWIVAILGGMLVVWVYSVRNPRRWWN